ncbi:hypothetical protein [Polaribacter sp. OB-PA-B3]
MEIFSEIKRKVIIRHVARNESLFLQFCSSKLASELDVGLGWDKELDAQTHRDLLGSWIISDEAIIRIYVLINYENRLNELFEYSNAHETLFFSELEFQLIYNYQKQIYKNSFVENPQYALEEYIKLLKNKQLYKLFENEANEQFLMPRRDD